MTNELPSEAICPWWVEEEQVVCSLEIDPSTRDVGHEHDATWLREIDLCVCSRVLVEVEPGLGGDNGLGRVAFLLVELSEADISFCRAGRTGDCRGSDTAPEQVGEDGGYHLCPLGVDQDLGVFLPLLLHNPMNLLDDALDLWRRIGIEVTNAVHRKMGIERRYPSFIVEAGRNLQVDTRTAKEDPMGAQVLLPKGDI